MKEKMILAEITLRLEPAANSAYADSRLEYAAEAVGRAEAGTTF